MIFYAKKKIKLGEVLTKRKYAIFYNFSSIKDENSSQAVENMNGAYGANLAIVNRAQLSFHRSRARNPPV